MVTRNSEFKHVIVRLEFILNEVWDQRPAGASVDINASLLSLGVDSLTLVLLLDKVGSEFHIDWDAEVSPSAVSSLSAIADLVVKRNSDRAALA